MRGLPASLEGKGSTSTGVAEVKAPKYNQVRLTNPPNPRFRV